MKYRNTAISALVAIALCLAAGSVIRGEVIEQIIVKVNGEILTKTELENRQIAALRQAGQQIDPKTDDAQLRQMLDQVTPQLLVNTVDEMLLVQRGRELGYKMADDQFNSVLENIKKDNKIESDEQFQAALKAENMTLSDLRKNLERQMIVSRVQQNEVMSKIAVNDEEARVYYDAHRTEFTSPRTITLREILVNVPGDGQTVNVGLDEQAKAKIDGIRQRALNGDSFEKLAADLSDAAVAHQRRPHRSAEHLRPLARRAEADRADEAGRHHRAPPRRARLPDPEARKRHDGRHEVVRRGARGHLEPRLHRQAA